MCIVIDSDAFSAVFTETNKDHLTFAAVKRRIDRGKLIVVYGGTEVLQEYGHNRRKLLRDLRGRGMAVAISARAVDERYQVVRKKTKGTACNDQHFIALLGASHCLLICTNDKKAHPFYKKKELYPNDMGRVRIYGCADHVHLLKESDVGTLRNTEPSAPLG